LKNLRNGDVSRNKDFRTDEFNREDVEEQYLDAHKVKPANTQRFVENYVTGKFIKMKKDYDPNQAIN